MADELREWKPRNRLANALAGGLKSVNAFAAAPFGFQNPPGEMLVNALALPQIANTLERYSYGQPLTNAGKANVPMLPSDTADALMAVAPAVAKWPRQAAGTLGLLASGGIGLDDLAHASAPIAGGVSAMMSAKELRQKLIEEAAKLLKEEPYAYHGVRVFGPAQNKVKVGSVLPKSSNWVDGVPKSTKLDGTAVFEIRGRDLEQEIDRALAYNLGDGPMRVGIVTGDDLGRNMMPEAGSALIKKPEVRSMYGRPDELSSVTRIDELRRILGVMGD